MFTSDLRVIWGLFLKYGFDSIQCIGDWTLILFSFGMLLLCLSVVFVSNLCSVWLI